jgi:RHS repeat-associated protein
MVDVAGGNTVYHYLNDRLGTPEILTDANGVVRWEAWYEPFGEAHVHPSSSVVNNIRLPGQYFDQETGLHYNYHRYYDPRMGRYLTPDPIGLKSGINLFPYVQNNPVKWIDIMGLARWKGYLTVTGGGQVYGGGVLVGGFESEVYNGKKAKVIVIGLMGGVTAGLPVSTTVGEITMLTPGEPNPADFFGAISFISANAGLVVTGGASYVEIGLAKSEGLFSFQYGLDASTSAYVGWSFIVDRQLHEILNGKDGGCE